ncbi:MAG: metallophosphoesterase family protein [Solirubrobacteraceae bacterium]
MIKDFLDKDEVGKYVAAMREQAATKGLDKQKMEAAAQAIGGRASQPVEAVLAALPTDNTGEASSGEATVKSPFFSRNPAVSLLQTSLEDEARAVDPPIVHEPKTGGLFPHIAGAIEALRHEAEHIGHTIETVLDPEKFSTTDSEWVTRVADATLDRLAKGNRPFNHVPAEYAITEANARIVIVGDWGSGLPRAQAVARLMAGEIEEATAQGRTVHVIHLGDVYYSGDPVEVQRRVLADGMWPVTVAQAQAGVKSWALNGNHDMYSGGWGFFDTLLTDPRFKNQSSPDGNPTSFFRIRTPTWDLIGLDTSWDLEVLSLGKSGVLADPQASVVAVWADEAERAEPKRKVMLLSHHQFVSCYDHTDIGTVLPHKLAPLLERREIDAWIWGHEHRCVGLESEMGAPPDPPFMRCIGHGGIPVPAIAAGTAPPKPGIWQTEGSFHENDDDWAKFGFAVLDFDEHAGLTIRYRDDEGDEDHPPEAIG